MAKQKTETNEKNKLGYPSLYGSHSSMIDEAKTSELNNNKLVVLKDNYGYYTTERSRLDSGLADPNRYRVERLEKLFGKKDKDLK
jgi:hypothetical protein